MINREKFEQEVQMGVTPAMGDHKVILTVVGNILGAYIKEASEINWSKSGNQFIITHNEGTITFTNGVNPQFSWND
jgi:hypothetical protein